MRPPRLSLPPKSDTGLLAMAGFVGRVRPPRMSKSPSKQVSLSPFLNRELSWLEFNQRVLDEALNPSVPLLERVKFFCITNSNLDEFFEVRVAGLKQQIESDVVERSPDGMTASETLRAVTRRVRALVDTAYGCWRDSLVPELAEHRIGNIAGILGDKIHPDALGADQSDDQFDFLQ